MGGVTMGSSTPERPTPAATEVWDWTYAPDGPAPEPKRVPARPPRQTPVPERPEKKA